MGARVVFVFFQTVPCLRLDDMGLSTLCVCGSARRLPDFFLCWVAVCIGYVSTGEVGYEGRRKVKLGAFPRGEE